MENLTKENVYVKVESKEQAEMYAAVLKSLKQPMCNSFYMDSELTRSSQEALLYSLQKWTCGNKGNLKEVSFGQLIDIITKPEKIAVKVDNEKEFRSLMRLYNELGYKTHNDLSVFDVVEVWSKSLYPQFVKFEDKFGSYYPNCPDGYKIVDFSDFAKEHNIKLPIITTVDGVDLFEGDHYHAAVINNGGSWGCKFYKNIYNGHLAITRPDTVKAFSNKQSAEKWINEQNEISINKSEANSIRQIMQNAITLLMSHAHEDFVSKSDAKTAGVDLHNLMVSLPETFILDDILNELKRAESKHPNWPDDKLYAAAIVSEESGEVMKEAVKIQMNESDASLDNLRKETIQTAATCIRLLKNL